MPLYQIYLHPFIDVPWHRATAACTAGPFGFSVEDDVRTFNTTFLLASDSLQPYNNNALGDLQAKIQRFKEAGMSMGYENRKAMS